MPAAKFQNLLDSAQGNCYPAMLENLATHLGVFADSLKRLGLGWCPIVQFKKKSSFHGWWVIPERDEEGEPVGLGLRSRDDAKFMYPNSKHGLIYEVNPDHEKGVHGYEAGPQNWIRTMDAGLPCPICGKPDGCLLSSENPHDPKAAVCIRTESGRRLRFGFLHILKAEGNFRSSSILPDNARPVLVVEGMSDAATGLDLGYVSVGRPSNLACLDTLAELVRGRTVWIIGENDQKSTGEWPGKQGMAATFTAIKSFAKEVKMVLPPEGVKDLRVWKVNYGLTAEILSDHVEKYGEGHLDGTTLPDNSMSTIAKAWLDEHYKRQGSYVLKHLSETWYKYAGSKYKAIDEEYLRSDLYNWQLAKYAIVESSSGPKPVALKLASGQVSGVIDACLGPCQFGWNGQVPGWVNGKNGPDPMNLISFTNGILDVDAYLRGDSDYMIEPTPDYFTLFSSPHAFDPSLKCPKWAKFLQQVIGDDPGKIMLLREWFGYCLIPSNKYQKMMVLQGVPRGGKGTVCHMLTQMLGGEQCTAFKLDELTERFELADWINCLAAIDDDAHLGDTSGSIASLGMLKALTGDGLQSVKRKFQSKLSLMLKTRMTIALNELPELPDFMGAMLPRLNVVGFKNSFIGRENFGLWSELDPEAAALIPWALEGLRRLRQNNRFTEPASSRDILARWAVATNPLAGFIRECCDPSGDAVYMDQLFDAWAAWSGERRIRPMSKSAFFERIKPATPYPIVEHTVMQDGRKHSVYQGIALQPWAARKLLGKPQ